jgi:tetratricopeptide (TPR) repeat protein
LDNYAAGLEGLAFAKRARGKGKHQALELLATGGLEALRSVSPNIQGIPACEALLERSWALRYEDTGQMVQLALAAALVADRVEDAELGPEKILDLRCRAWTELGNAWRVNDDLDRAEDSLGRATELFLLGTRDEFLGARLFDVLASLYAAQRLFEPALTTLDIVVDLYRRCGDEHLAGRALISKGIYTGDQGDVDRAVTLLQQGLTSVDERRDPELVFSALQCQVWLLVESGKFRDAQFAIWELRRVRPDVGGHVNRLKLRWLDARIFVGLEKLDRAEYVLEQVKHEFEEEDLPYKAALAGLELGAVWLRQGRVAEAEKVVLECSEVFLSLRIKREALAAVLVARKAAERKLLTLEVLNSAIERLRREEQAR